MRNVLGYLVFFVGLVFLNQAFFPGSSPTLFGALTPVASPSWQQSEPDQTTTIAKNVPPSRITSFSPGEQLVAVPESTFDVVAFFSSQFAALQPTPALAQPAAGEIAARDMALEPWRSAVVSTAADASPAGPKAAAPLDDRSRATLAREIQSELKRVGCYSGAIDGNWGAASKRAMVAFIERVNASLPLNQPDDILLLLVKSHASGTCSSACPVGQTLSHNNDRCVPDAILAHTDKQLRPATEPYLVASAAPIGMSGAENVLPASPLQPARDGWPLPGRMSIGGPALAGAAETTGAEPGAISKLASTEARDTTLVSSGTTVGTLGGDVITKAPSAEKAAKPKSAMAAGNKVSNSSSRKTRYAGEGRYRAVQHLFEHPLGRL